MAAVGKPDPASGPSGSGKTSAPARTFIPAGVGATVSTLVQYRIIKTPLYYLTLLLAFLRIIKKNQPGEYVWRVKWCPVYYGGSMTGWQTSKVVTEEEANTTYKGYEKRKLTTEEHKAWNPQLYTKDGKLK